MNAAKIGKVIVLVIEFSGLIYVSHQLIEHGPVAWLGAMFAAGIALFIYFIVDVIRS